MNIQEVLKNHKIWVETGRGERANLHGANLHGANLCGADLCWANLRGVDLCGADLREADLRWADLNGADLREANLHRADLCGANLDFSSGIPFHCRGTNITGDKRLFSQLVYHLTRQNWEHEGEDVQAQIEQLKKLECINWFCEYRIDLTRVEEDEQIDK
jgi:hypothetical protein